MVDVGNLGSAKIALKSTMDFELDLKKKLKWNKSDWVSSGESGTRINKLVSSMHYWKHRLKPALVETSVVFTVYNESQDIKNDISLIIQAIESVDSAIQVVGFSSFRNPRYLCIYLSQKEVRDLVHENFKMYNNGFVVYLDWALESENNVSELKVHWLPMTFELDLIEKELCKYVQFLGNIREGLKMMSGREVPSGMVSFKVKLKEGVRAIDVPHTAVIGGMEALLTMPGRQPLCLNCATLGHISKYCKLRYCKKCACLKEKVHDCDMKSHKVSYAAALKIREPDSNNVDSDDEEAAFIAGKKEEENKEPNLGLESQITALEKQLNSFKTEAKKITKFTRDEGRAAAKVEVNKQVPENVEDNEEKDPNDLGMDFEDESSLSDEHEDASVANVGPLDINRGLKDDVLQSQKFQKVSKRKRKKKNMEGPIIGSSVRKVTSTLSGVLTRSYGKPNYGNQRRLKEEADFKKSCSKSPDYQEYVFTDQDTNTK